MCADSRQMRCISESDAFLYDLLIQQKQVLYKTLNLATIYVRFDVRENVAIQKCRDIVTIDRLHCNHKFKSRHVLLIAS